MDTVIATAKPKRSKNELWGKWIDKSRFLILHPLNQNGAAVIEGAFANLLFSVQISYESSEWGDITHLWIRRHDGQPPVWREMQRIKDELIGPERTAVEVYPARADLIDAAPMYHLWVLPEGFKLPFSLAQ